jgi:preprotein translocase subunit SecG
MGLIGIVLILILIVSAVLLVLVVLVQDEQGEGIGGIFGGGSNTSFGSRSGNVLTRFTAVLAAVFLVCCFGVAWINRTPSPGNVIGKARQQALGATEQQSWWVQTTPPSAPGGVVAPEGASKPAGASGSGATPSTSGGAAKGASATDAAAKPAGQGGQ